MGSISAAERQLDVTVDQSTPITYPEVEEIARAVSEAAGIPVEVGPTETDEIGEQDWEASYYWDVATMAPLNKASAAAIARLRAYKPPAFPLWDRLPASRRAAVLLLLYADRKGDLRVVITMRAASLRSFSGHAALPGGKADSVDETPYQIARREAWEEIGLPMDDTKLPAPFKIEHLCYLPFNLAKTELVVRPCVALLHTSRPPVPTCAISNTSASTTNSEPTAEESLIPRLDAKEVAAVFSAPFYNFLRDHDEPELYREGCKPLTLPAGKWYDGYWSNWHEHPWRVHFFYVPVVHQHVAKPFVRDGGLDSLAEDVEEDPKRYKVWGMTARMLVDAAKVAYDEEPDFEHNKHAGDEKIILELEEMGRLKDKKQVEERLPVEDGKKNGSGDEGGAAKM